MFDLNKLVRATIRSLQPYISARDEYVGTEGIFLDANENPFGTLNRYPDPYQKQLKEELGRLKGLDTSQIFLGNGSDEVIDLLYRIFCEPGQDKAMIFPPTYGMYKVSAGINAVEVVEVPLTETFQFDLPSARATTQSEDMKLAFICSPNNPTGNSMDANAVEAFIRSFNGICVIDEAYIDFSSKPSWLQRLDEFPNLVVIQTFSKAWGLAAARLGVAYASEEIISLLNKVKPPYNVSRPNQEAALSVLTDVEKVKENVRLILAQRDWLIKELQDISLVKRLYLSDANFLLVEVDDANVLYEYLIEKNLIVRNRHGLVHNCLRITVGTEEENIQLVTALNEFDL